jgi:hypothetical protein
VHKDLPAEAWDEYTIHDDRQVLLLISSATSTSDNNEEDDDDEAIYGCVPAFQSNTVWMHIDTMCPNRHVQIYFDATWPSIVELHFLSHAPIETSLIR